jgi:hypothetical protein
MITDSPQREGKTVFAESTLTSAFLKRTTPVDFRRSDIIATCIDKELTDNRIHNGVLSVNALSLRNAAFKSKFKYPVEGPKKPPAPKTNKRKRTKSDIGYASSEITEYAHSGSVSVMELDDEDGELEFVGAPVLRPGNTNKQLKRVEKNGSGLDGSQNGSPGQFTMASFLILTVSKYQAALADSDGFMPSMSLLHYRYSSNIILSWTQWLFWTSSISVISISLRTVE